MAGDPSSPSEFPHRRIGHPFDGPPPAPSGEAVVELQRVVRRCLDHHGGAGDVDGPSITVVGVHRSDSDVLVRDPGDPEEAVVGLVVPRRYSAVVVLANSVVAMPPQRTHRSGTIAIGVDRAASIASMLATEDEMVQTDEPRGWLVDACLRSLGLATAPTDASPLAYPVAIWLDRLMVAILNAPAGTPITWSDAVRLCPVPRRWRSSDPVDLGLTLASTTTSWSALRAATVQGRRSPAGVSPEQAAWMDDPMFARWCLGGFPDLSGLRGDVEFLAPVEVAEHVELTLRAAWSAFG